MSDRHPLPWKVEHMVLKSVGTEVKCELWNVVDAKEKVVFAVTEESTALEIVASVNSRERLVEALRGLMDVSENPRDRRSYDSPVTDSDRQWTEAYRKAVDALSEGGAV